MISRYCADCIRKLTLKEGIGANGGTSLNNPPMHRGTCKLFDSIFVDYFGCMNVSNEDHNLIQNHFFDANWANF